MFPRPITVDLWTFPHPGTRRCELPLAALLARYLPSHPLDIRRSPAGKPHLDPRLACHFSIAHANGLSLLAVANRPLGIDLESLTAPPSTADGLLRYLPPRDRRHIQSQPPPLRLTALLTAWTRLEARAKASGLGLRPLLALPPSPDLHPWQLHHLAIPGYAAALAIRARRIRLRQPSAD